MLGRRDRRWMEVFNIMMGTNPEIASSRIYEVFRFLFIIFNQGERRRRSTSVCFKVPAENKSMIKYWK
jgi:hypothetical protein